VTAAGSRGARLPPVAPLRRLAANWAAWSRALIRPPCASCSARQHPAGPPLSRLAVGTAVATAAVAAAMLLLDSRAISQHGRLPLWLIALFDEITDFGKSDWFLVPTGILLVGIAATASPALGRITYLVLMALAARLGFVFLAVGLPSLVVTVGKRVIGRARPLRIEGRDVYFAPFSWRVDFASFPSGHSTTAFAAAVALGALFPRARPVLWIYAGLIALSRVILTAHYPSDVLAGAIVGAVGALLVRRWFAARRLAFVLRPDGPATALPGPSLQRIKKVAARLVGP